MKTNKSQKFMLSNSENSKEVIQLSQALSNSKLNNQFWNSLKETINMKKENQSIKGRIVTAKRILTPIIQELMKDALKQIEAEKLEETEVNMEMKGKEVEVLYNNLKAADIWHVQKDVLTNGDEWAMRILREISRDFEQPFDELHEKVEVKEIEEQSSKDILLSTKLLTKLGAIYHHLGNIIKRLNERCGKRTTVDTDDSLNDISNQRMNFETSYSTDTGCSTPRKFNDQMHFPSHVQSFCISQRNVGYPKQKHNLSVNRSRIQFTVENACSAINFENIETTAYSISRKLFHDVAVSYHAFFEENKNNVGNKEIVIKCLEDLEKVRNYLEAIRDNRQCEKPKFCDLESCRNDECLESQPHLHSNLHNMPMVLKLNKHAEDNEHISDLIIGIPSLNESSPDVHILLNTKDQHVDIKRASEQANRVQNESKIPYRVSRIPKPIDKRRIDMQKYVGSKSMKISLENKQRPQRKTANLLIFDPDDPSKSIIKMKEQKMMSTNDSRSIVAHIRFQKNKTRTDQSKINN